MKDCKQWELQMWNYLSKTAFSNYFQEVKVRWFSMRIGWWAQVDLLRRTWLENKDFPLIFSLLQRKIAIVKYRQCKRWDICKCLGRSPHIYRHISKYLLSIHVHIAKQSMETVHNRAVLKQVTLLWNMPFKMLHWFILKCLCQLFAMN